MDISRQQTSASLRAPANNRRFEHQTAQRDHVIPNLARRDSTPDCSGGQISEERFSAGATVTRRHFAERSVDVATNTTYTFTRDHLGSVRELLNPAGQVVSRFDYDPWGQRSWISGTVDSSFGYAGYFRHAASGLDLTLFRAYDPELGRWLSRDPILEAGGLNVYGYVGNSGVTGVDVWGLTEKDIQAALELADQQNSDLNVPEPVKTRDLPGHVIGFANPLTRRVILDDQYTAELSEAESIELYEVVVHESIHTTKPRIDSVLRPIEHDDIYQEFKARIIRDLQLIKEKYKECHPVSP